MEMLKILGKITSKFNSIKYTLEEHEFFSYLGNNSNRMYGGKHAYLTDLRARTHTKDFPRIDLDIIFLGSITKVEAERSRILKAFKDKILSAFKEALFYELIKNGEIGILYEYVNKDSIWVTNKFNIDENEELFYKLIKEKSNILYMNTLYMNTIDQSAEENEKIYILYKFEIDDKGDMIFGFKQTHSGEFDYKNNSDFDTDMKKTVKLEILDELHKYNQEGLGKMELIRSLYFDDNAIEEGINQLKKDESIKLSDDIVSIIKIGEVLREQLRKEMGRGGLQKRRIGFNCW